MARYRLTFEFEPAQGSTATAGSRNGWSESWYTADLLTDQAAVARGVQYATVRRTLLTDGWALTTIRASRLDPGGNPIRRGALVFVAPANQPGVYQIGVQGINEQPYDALEIAVVSDTGHRRNFQMRGIGNDVISAGARFVNPAPFGVPFGLWLRDITGTPLAPLLQSPFCLRTRVLPQSANIAQLWFGQPGSPGTATPQSPVIDIVTTSVFSGQEFLTIQNLQGVVNANGAWQAKNLIPPPVAGIVRLQLWPKRRTSLSGAPSLQGQVRWWTFSFDPIAIATPGYGTSRRTGRPAQVTRGRRSNRRS